jgi:hypothetical protein
VPLSVSANHTTQGTSAYRSKINKLDDDIVKNIPIPILFGITLSTMTPNFGDPRGGGTRKHEGLDIMALEGAPIVSPTDAVVIMTGTGPDSGKYVTTANPGGETFTYMHLNKILVKNGEVLTPGALVGYVGDTGNASGGAPHLHFEIRKNRKPVDPFLRITKEFTLEEKIKLLKEVLKDVPNEAVFIEFLTKEYLGVFYQAQTEGLVLPKNLEKKLPARSAMPLRDLEVGSEGGDVMTLQSMLISEGYLKIEAPTGYFGTRTLLALEAFQRAKGIVPATGHYGATTRAYLLKDAQPVKRPSLPMTEKQMLAQIVELRAQIKEMQLQQEI